MNEEIARAKRYSKIKNRLILANICLTFAFLIIMHSLGVSNSLKDLVMGWAENFYLQIALYITLFFGVFYIITFSLDLYDGFFVEHKFSLSNQTFSGWLKDNLRKEILSFIIFLLVVELIYLCLRLFPTHWWLLAAAGWVGLTIVFSKIAPVLIIPLFYKCLPLRNLELKERLLRLSRASGCPIKEVFEINLSKATKRANAGLAGMGNTRRIILSDTLLSNYSDEEIEAVMAHELGHFRMHHLWKLLGIGAGLAIIGFYLTYLILGWATDLFGYEGIADIAAFPILSLIFLILGFLIMPIQNGFSRHLEKEADRFSIEQTKATQPFCSAMTKLGQQNLRDPSPGKFVEVLLYDHPPISKRLNYAKEFEASKADTE